MNSAVITVIGGGSVNWMRGLMKDIYMIDELGGGEIRLVDPNSEHVQAVADMLNTFNRLRDKAYKISVIEDLDEALSAADFVITTFSPGAMDAFWNDLEIPVKYGIRQPVSMTVGPCGISASLRTVPAVFELVEAMERLCPHAWLLNVTNPMSTVARAMNMAAQHVKVVGLCHEYHSLSGYLGQMIPELRKPDDMNVTEYLYRWLPQQGFKSTVAGLNHFIWLTTATLNGQDMLPQIRRFCHENWESRSEVDLNRSQATQSYRNNHAVKLALCRQFGFLPLVGDRHLIEFYPSLCNVRNGYGMKYDVLKTTVDSRRLDKVYQLANIRQIASGQTKVKWERSGEELSEILRTVVTDSETDGIINMPNQGQITNMPADIAVETLGSVSRAGLRPKPSGELPGSVASLCRLHADIHELTVKAALSGSRDLLIEALSLDPLSAGADFSELPDLADELLEANREWLPRFYN